MPRFSPIIVKLEDWMWIGGWGGTRCQATVSRSRKAEPNSFWRELARGMESGCASAGPGPWRRKAPAFTKSSTTIFQTRVLAMLCRIRHRKPGWNVSLIHELSAVSLAVIGITLDADSQETTAAPVAQRSRVKFLINSWRKQELVGASLDQKRASY